MDQKTVLWSLTLLFGGLVLSGALRRVTEDSPVIVIVAVQLGAFALVVALLVVVVRRLR